MMTYRILIPIDHIKKVGNLRFKKFKVLRDAAKPFLAAKYALYRCFQAQYTDRKKSEKTRSMKGWVPLYSQYMGRIAGNNKQWVIVKNTLIEAGYLECDNKSKHGEKSFGFRLGRLLRDTAWSEHTEDLSVPEDSRPRMEWLGIDKSRAHTVIDKIAGEKLWDYRVTKGWHTRIENFSPSFKLCKTGRAYSDANQLPKRVRNALLIDGEATAEIDIVNCQPMLLATIYPTQSEEWRRYKDLAERGQVYEAMMKFSNMTREEVKAELIPFIFGGSRPKAETFLQESFPELLAAIKERRNVYRNALVYELQGKESGIIVNLVCKAFKAASIHDGVRVKQADAVAVKEFIESTFYKLWGLTPKLTTEFSDHTARSKVA